MSGSGQSRRIGPVHNAPGMSAMPPIATELMPRNETSRCATSGCEQAQQDRPLFDHLVGEREQRRQGFEPSIVAVCALMTSSNLVDCMTDKSAVFASFRMRPA
jgi:hypothetical protein